MILSHTTTLFIKSTYKMIIHTVFQKKSSQEMIFFFLSYFIKQHRKKYHIE